MANSMLTDKCDHGCYDSVDWGTGDGFVPWEIQCREGHGTGAGLVGIHLVSLWGIPLLLETTTCYGAEPT